MAIIKKGTGMRISQVNYVKSPVKQAARKVSFGESEFVEDGCAPKTPFEKAIEDLNNEVFYKIEAIWAMYPNSEQKRNEELEEVLKYKERKLTKIYKELHPSNQGFWRKLLNKFC